MPNRKRYNVIKGGITIMESKTIDEIKSVIDISAQGLRESENTGKEAKGYYFEAIANAKTSRCLIPKTLLEEWDRVTEKFRKAKRMNAVNCSISIIEENTKLKAEIEQLKSTISEMETTTAQEDDLK